jgi:hypothetical protein
MMGYETSNILQTLDSILAFLCGIGLLSVVSLLIYLVIDLFPR